MVAEELVDRWDLGRAKDRFRGRIAEGRVPGGDPHAVPGAPAGSKAPRVAVLCPQPFGDVRTRLGGGLAGHNGLKSIKRELGGADFMRVRVGVGRPDSTDPEIVSAYVLGRFQEDESEVRDLVGRAREHVERLVLGHPAQAAGDGG